MMKKPTLALPLALLLMLTCTATFCQLEYKFFSTSSANSVGAVKEVDLPIVMYHSVMKSSRGKYVIHPDQLEMDFVKYKELGYTPVFMKEVIDFVDNGTPLPEKPMVITFDDGHYNNFYYVLPIIKRLNIKIVINPVTSFSEDSELKGHSNPNYSYLTLEQIKQLTDTKLVEIGNHSHSMHSTKGRYGIAQKRGEDAQTYKTALQNDIKKAQELFSSAGVPSPTTFAYPFGKYAKTSQQVLAELGFRAMLTCNEGISTIRQGDPECLHFLKRYNRSGNISTEQFIKKVFHTLS